MKKLILVRHCQTEDDRYPHRSDPALTALGRQQAHEIREHFQDESVDAILTSIYLRTQQTAEAVRQDRQIPIFANIALNEFFIRDDGSGAETTEQGVARVMRYLYQFHPYFRTVMVISHKTILRIFLKELLHTPFDELDNYFKLTGESHLLQNDWEQGDKTWTLLDSFTPRGSSFE